MEQANQSKQKNRKINRQWSKIEIKNLIEEFESRRDLWDPSRGNYSNR